MAGLFSKLVSKNRYRIGAQKGQSGSALLDYLNRQSSLQTSSELPDGPATELAAEILASAIADLVRKAPISALTELAGIGNKDNAAQMVRGTNNWLLCVLGTGRDIRGLVDIAERNGDKLPGLLAIPETSAAIGTYSGAGIGVVGTAFTGSPAFDIRPNSTLFFSDIRIETEENSGRNVRYSLPFGIILSPGRNVQIDRIDEIVESLWASALSAVAETRRNANR